MIIDCDTCDMRNTRTCDDCIVTALVGEHGILDLADDERLAIESMSTIGLVPQLRFQTPPARRAGDG